MKEKTEEAVVQNLMDAGCDDCTIQKYLNCMRNNNKSGGCKILESHRKTLLGIVHSGEKQIECLDYFMYQLNKHNKGE